MSDETIVVTETTTTNTTPTKRVYKPRVAKESAQATSTTTTKTTTKKVAKPTEEKPVAIKDTDTLTEAEAWKIVEENFYFGEVNKGFTPLQKSQLMRTENIRELMRLSEKWNAEKSVKLSKKESLKVYVTPDKLSSQFMWEKWGEPYTYTTTEQTGVLGETKVQSTFSEFCSIDKCYKPKRVETQLVKK